MYSSQKEELRAESHINGGVWVFNLIKLMLQAICHTAIAFLNAVVDEISCVISYYQMWVDTHCGVVVGEYV